MPFILAFLSLFILLLLVVDNSDIDLRSLGRQAGASIREFWLGLTEDSSTEGESMEIPQIEDDETLDEFERRLERAIQEEDASEGGKSFPVKSAKEKRKEILEEERERREKEFNAATNSARPRKELYSKQIGPGHRVIRSREVHPSKDESDK